MGLRAFQVQNPLKIKSHLSVHLAISCLDYKLDVTVLEMAT